MRTIGPSTRYSPGGDRDPPAALVAAPGDGVVDGLARIDGGVRRGPEVEDAVFGIAELGGMDGFENFPGPFGQAGAAAVPSVQQAMAAISIFFIV